MTTLSMPISEVEKRQTFHIHVSRDVLVCIGEDCFDLFESLLNPLSFLIAHSLALVCPLQPRPKVSHSSTISLYPILRMPFQILLHTLRPRDRVLEKRHRLHESLIRLGATEAQEATPSRTEALAAQT